MKRSKKLLLDGNLIRIQILSFIVFVFFLLLAFIYTKSYSGNYKTGVRIISMYFYCYFILLLLMSFVNKKVPIMITGCFMTIFSAFRELRAVDDYNYYMIFSSVKDSWSNIFVRPEEKGFLLLNKLISFFTSDYQIASIIILIISVFAFIVAVNKWKDEVSPFFIITHYALFLLLRSTLAGLNRIQCAIPLFLVMLYWLGIKRDTKKALVILIIGSFIHLSFLVTSVIFVPIVLGKTKQGKEKLGLSSILTLILTFTIIPIALKTVLLVLPAAKYAGYSDKIVPRFSMFSVLLCLILAFVLFSKRRLIEDMGGNEPLYYMLIISLSCGIYFQILFSANSIGRVTYYFLFAIPIMMGMIKQNRWLIYNRVSSYIMYEVVAIIYFFNTQLMDTYTQSIAIYYENILFK